MTSPTPRHMQTIAEQMADTLIDEEVDIHSLNDVIRALTNAGYRSSVINMYMDEAITLIHEAGEIPL